MIKIFVLAAIFTVLVSISMAQPRIQGGLSGQMQGAMPGMVSSNTGTRSRGSRFLSGTRRTMSLARRGYKMMRGQRGSRNPTGGSMMSNPMSQGSTSGGLTSRLTSRLSGGNTQG